VHVNVGDQIRKRAAEIDKMLPGKEKKLEELDAEVKTLRQERRELARLIRQLDGPPNGGAPAVTDEQLIAAVKKLGGKDVTSAAVAKHLDVTTRNVARKMRKLVDDGAFTGDPESGYSLVAVPA
jgi:hypothetical protein